jgi:cyclic dehypoxanthinyl futalosine synthase
MNTTELLEKALREEFLTAEEGQHLFLNAPMTDLMFVGNEMRKRRRSDGKVTWIIDRNVNTTNVCIANCKFCNFFRVPGHPESYITSMRHVQKKDRGDLPIRGRAVAAARRAPS